MSKIINVTTLPPPHQYSTEEIIEHANSHWFNEMDIRIAQKAKRIFKATQINKRYAVVPKEIVFETQSFEEKNDLYKIAMKNMGIELLTKVFEENDISPHSIDVLITTSCTGLMIPSVDAYLIDHFSMGHKVMRLPITEMGCAGGTAGLITAKHLLYSPNIKRIALLSLEAPSLTLQKDDHSLENIVSSAIFSDGLSCVIIDKESEFGIEIGETHNYHFNNSTHLMGFNLKNPGLHIVLDRKIPHVIQENFPNIMHEFLSQQSLNIEDIDHYLVHPGGKKIIESIQKVLAEYSRDVSISRNILYERGNMSSATIIHILEKYMNKNIKNGEKGLMMAFGPGFLCQGIHLKWND